MVEWRKRKPLVLSSTKALVDSLLTYRKTSADTDGIDKIAPATSARTLQLTAGILRVFKDTTVDSVDGFCFGWVVHFCAQTIIQYYFRVAGESDESDIHCLRSMKESLQDPLNKLSTSEFNNSWKST